MISTIGGLFNLNHFDQGSRANDVIVIRHKDGTLHSSPFNIRFGRAKIWNSLNKVVQVEVNGVLTSAVMKIGKGGEAYWLQPTYGHFNTHPERQHQQPDGQRTSGNDVMRKGGSLPQDPCSERLSAQQREQPSLPPQPHRVTFSDDAVSAASRPYAAVKGGTTDAASRPQPRGAAVAPSNPSVSAASHSTGTAAATSTANKSGPFASTSQPRASATTAEASSSAASDTSADAVPLLRERDDGTIGVPRSAIHSAGDAEQARLALQAVAAAEKSRKRLSRLITKDPFLLESARQEGEATDVVREAVEAEREEQMHMYTDSLTALAHHGDAPATADNVDSTQGAAAVAPVEAAQQPAHGLSIVGSPLHAKHGDRFPVAPATTESAVPAAASSASASASGGSPTVAVAQANAEKKGQGERQQGDKQSVASSGSSDELLLGEDDDDYFLDPIDASDFDDDDLGVPAKVSRQVLQNCSFSSSVTSGVSLNDLPADSEAGVDASAGEGVRGEGRGGAMTLTLAQHQGVNHAGDSNTATAAAAESNLPGKVPPEKGEALRMESSQALPSAEQSRRARGGEDAVAVVVSARPIAAGKGTLEAAEDDEREEADWVVVHDGGDGGSEFDLMEEEYDRVAGGGCGPESDGGVNSSAGRLGQGRPHGRAAGEEEEETNAGGQTSYFTRTLIPTEEDLQKLNLVEGCNTVRYLARKSSGELVAVSCSIFLWDAMDRLVVSDIDGTITKSDLWGHFYAALGKGGDWTHPGICSLFSKIVGNGYKMVYLTARSVAQIDQTKHYLWTLEQEGAKLPLGPVLTAPQRFFTALTQEVSKQSHVFKIACLTGVKAAFPPHSRPFFAGFGNRYNDLISYDAVGVPTHKIFIIDPSSVLHVCQVRQTYRNLAHLVDVTFPRIHRRHYRHRSQHHHQQQQQQQQQQHPDRNAESDRGNSVRGGREPQGREALADTWSGMPMVKPPNGAERRAEPMGGGGGSGSGSSNASFFSSDNDSPTMAGEAARFDEEADEWGGGVDDKRSAMFTMSGNDLRESLRIPDDGERARTNATAAGRARALGGEATAASLTTAATSSGGGGGDRVQRLGPRLPSHFSFSHVDEDVMADPEFSSYNFWRIDPRSLVTTAKKTVPAGVSPTPASATAAAAATTAPPSTATTGANTTTGAVPAAPATTTTSTIAGDRDGSSSASSRPSATDARGGARGGATTAKGNSLLPTIVTPTAPPTTTTTTTTTTTGSAAGGNSLGSQSEASATPSTGKRGFFSFNFSLGRGKKEPAAPAEPTPRNPYSHPDYMAYTISLPPQQTTAQTGECSRSTSVLQPASASLPASAEMSLKLKEERPRGSEIAEGRTSSSPVKGEEGWYHHSGNAGAAALATDGGKAGGSPTHNNAETDDIVLGPDREGPSSTGVD